MGVTDKYLLTIFECVNLLGQYFADTLLALVDVVVSDGVHDHLLELGEFSSAPRRDLLRHLLVIVF